MICQRGYILWVPSPISNHPTTVTNGFASVVISPGGRPFDKVRDACVSWLREVAPLGFDRLPASPGLGLLFLFIIHLSVSRNGVSIPPNWLECEY